MSVFDEVMDKIGVYDENIHPRNTKNFPYDEELKGMSYRDKFVLKSMWAHGKGKYSYDGVGSPLKSNIRVNIECPRHGIFSVRTGEHMRGRNHCKDCRDSRTGLSIDDVFNLVKKSETIDYKDFDYSHNDYPLRLTRGNGKRLTILCKKHNVFFNMNLYNHCVGVGCPECVSEFRAKPRGTTEGFVEKARNVHGDKFDYSESVYTGRHKKLKITCPDHGPFEQTAGNHLNGQECWWCRNNKISNSAKTTNHITEENKHESCFLYFVSFNRNGKSYEKVGITRQPSIMRRFKYDDIEDVEILMEYQSTYEDCFLKEKEILADYHDLRFECPELKGTFNGWSECFKKGIFKREDFPTE